MPLQTHPFVRPFPPETTLDLYDPLQIESLIHRLVPHPEGREMNQSERALWNLAEYLFKNPQTRSLQGVSPPFLSGWITIQNELQQQFPHFEAVTEILRDHWHLAYHARTGLQLPPMLLLGEPGLGKTFFAARLAQLLDLEYRYLSMATTTAGFVLSGMDHSWSEAKPGQIFQQLVYGRQANPLVLLDEIDKRSTDIRYDALSPLYSLLEGHTAQQFCDEFFPLPLDASRIQWVATANTLASIPEPIQSRMRVVTVRAPTRVEREQIAGNIYQDLVRKQPWGWLFDPELDTGVSTAVAEICQTPREIRQVLEQLCGHAVQRLQTPYPQAHALQPTLQDLPQRRQPAVAAFGFTLKTQQPSQACAG